MPGDFEPEQKRYLEGLMTGLQIAKTLRPAGGNGTASVASTGPNGAAPAAEPIGPDAAALRAQDRTIKAGGKLSDPEKFKRELHPFDAYERLKEQAAKNEPPKADDNFRWRFFGLFYCAPAQKSYMCRLRIPNGILNHWQFAGLADLAERYAGAYAHVTTRANLQMREVEPKNAVAMVEAIQDLGLCSRGSGADNIRNVTGTPTAGIDPQELIDTRPYAREWHFHILNDRSLYGIPRKFNVGFDGGGVIPVLEDTNDIGFQAVRVNDGYGIEPGVWFRLMLGGITGHRSFAGDTGVIVKPAEATAVADTVVRVFIDHGDRTNRAKARLKYVLDAWGFEKFVAALEERLGRKLVRATANAIAPRPAFDRFAHIGGQRQKQDGYFWIGIVLPVGRLTADQMRGIAKVAHDYGDGDIRLTVWQNLLISGVPQARLAEAKPPLRRHRSRPKRPRSAPVSSPAPAMPVAASPCPTPNGMPKRSRNGARAALRLISRSTFISPAARIPARSITSATSGFWAPRPKAPTTTMRPRPITSMSAAASGRKRNAAAKSTATSKPTMRRGQSNGCSKPISPIAPARKKASPISRAAMTSTR
jgi:ferredoxin-nitrite reductase